MLAGDLGSRRVAVMPSAMSPHVYWAATRAPQRTSIAFRQLNLANGVLFSWSFSVPSPRGPSWDSSNSIHITACGEESNHTLCAGAFLPRKTSWLTLTSDRTGTRKCRSSANPYYCIRSLHSRNVEIDFMKGAQTPRMASAIRGERKFHTHPT